MDEKLDSLVEFLANWTNYGRRFLCMRWLDYVDECIEAEEEPDVAYFVGVTLEEGW